MYQQTAPDGDGVRWHSEPVTDPVLQPFVEVCSEISPTAQVVRTWTDLHACDSFFMARLRRKSTEASMK